MTTRIKKTYGAADMLTAEKEQHLRDSLKWFANWHTTTPEESVLITFLTGRFRTFTKDARRILRQAELMGLVKIRNDVVTINVKLSLHFISEIKS